MMNRLSALLTSNAIDQARPASGTNTSDNAGAANDADTTFLALLAALGGRATDQDAADGTTWHDARGGNDAAADSPGTPSRNGGASTGSRSATHKHARTDATEADALAYGVPVLPQPQPPMLPQPLQPQTARDASASALFPDRVQGQPIMLPGGGATPGTGIVQPLSIYQPDSLEAPPGDVAPHPQGHNVGESGRNQLRPYSPPADGEGETRQAAKAAFVIGGADLPAGGAEQTNGRVLTRLYEAGVIAGNATTFASDQGTAADVAGNANKVHYAVNAQVAASGQHSSGTATASLTAFSLAMPAQHALPPPAEMPMVPTMPTQDATVAATVLATAGSPSGAFTLAASATAPFAASRDDRRMATVDGPATIVATPGSPTVRTLAASGTLTVNHPAIPVATARIVATAQTLPRGATAELQLRLRPPDLGAVQVILRRGSDGNLAVQLIPATHAAADALGANLHHLRAALDAHSPGQHADVTLHQPAGERDGSQQSSRHQNAPAGDEDLAPAPSPGATPRAVPPRMTSARAPTRTGVDYTA